MSIFAPVLSTLTADPFNAVSIEHLESLRDWITKPTADGSSRFTFAHILLPHAPFNLNADCSRNTGELRWWGDGAQKLRAARRHNFTEQLTCVNRQVLNAVDGFLAAHPDGVIMITGDHGPGSTLDVNVQFDHLGPGVIEERMRILSAYRLPGCEEQVRPELTPVNGTRLLANCAVGTKLAPVADRNYWADLDGKGTVTDITSRVRS